MEERCSTWTNMLSDETDVDALNLSMPPEDITTQATGGKGSVKRSSNYTQHPAMHVMGEYQHGSYCWK